MKKTIQLLLFFCCLSLTGWTQPIDVLITGKVEIQLPGFTTPVPDYDVLVSSANGFQLVQSDSLGIYRATVDWIPGSPDVYNVSTTDACSGLTLMNTILIDSTVMIQNFLLCDSIDTPVYPDTCVAYFGADPIDPSGLTIQFNDLSYAADPINSWSWDLGDGTTSQDPVPLHTYSNYGTYQVTLTIVTDSCSSSNTQTIIVDSLTNGCNCVAIYNPVCVSIDTLGVMGRIEFPNECEALCAGFTPADFVTCLVDSSNCAGFLTYSQVDSTGFTFNFGVTIVNGNGPFSYTWDFGDGTISTTANPQHTYNLAGLYPVSVQVVSSDGCVIDGFDFIQVGIDSCVCIAIYDPVCVLDPSGFFLEFPNECEARCAGYDPSTFINCQIDSTNCATWINATALDSTLHTYAFETYPQGTAPFVYLWDFGDGNQSMQANPVHTYDTTGLYTITVTVTNADSCVAVASYTVQAGLGDCGCTNVPYDPVCVVIPAIGHYTEFPNMCAALCAGAPPGAIVPCDSTGQGCYVDFGYTVLDSNGLKITFEANPYAPNINILTYQWDFGDGTSSTDPMPTHTYATGGIYDITLTVVYSDSCVTTTTQHICIGGGGVVTVPNCQALFSFNQDSLNYHQFYFVDQSLTDGTTRYLWDFGDGSTSSAQHPSHVYAEDGFYIITLTISSDSCLSTFANLVFVSDGAVYDSECQALFLPLIDINTLTVAIFNLSAANTAEVEVDFGDGTVVTGDPFPVHTYAAEGQYDITLTIITADGCTSSLTMRINLDGDDLTMTGNAPYRILTTSTNDPSETALSALTLYPNPVQSELTVKVASPVANHAELQIINLNGQLVQHRKVQLVKGENKLVLAVDLLPEGMYFIHIQSEKGEVSTRFVK